MCCQLRRRHQPYKKSGRAWLSKLRRLNSAVAYGFHNRRSKRRYRQRFIKDNAFTLKSLIDKHSGKITGYFRSGHMDKSAVFRLAFGGAAEVLGIEPDLVTYGKVIGGGFPVGAYGGRSDLMSQFAPEAPVTPGAAGQSGRHLRGDRWKRDGPRGDRANAAPGPIARRRGPPGARPGTPSRAQRTRPTRRARS